MSSPLLDELRERRGLAYHVSANADPLELGSQFVIEAATGPDQLGEFLTAEHGLGHHHRRRVGGGDEQQLQDGRVKTR